MESYQKEQFDGWIQVREQLRQLPDEERRELHAGIEEYLSFRKSVASFQDTHFADVCTESCYRNQRSACCSRDGIITFFADMVIDALVSDDMHVEHLLDSLRQPHHGFKCIYLGEQGCRWQLKPIVCEMFLCDPAKEQVLDRQPGLREEWACLEEKRKSFTWPDQPVLFDAIETFFLERGCRSALMYFHTSPGLQRIKRQSEGASRKTR